MFNKKSIENVVKLSKLSFGGTFQVLPETTEGIRVDKVVHNSGYMVSVLNAEKIVPGELTTEDVESYLSSNISELEKIDRYFGTWYNNQFWYLDISFWFEDKNTALQFAEENEQLAIWDCKNSQAIDIRYSA